MKNTHLLGLLGLGLGLANMGFANVEIKINESNPVGEVSENGQFSHQLKQQAQTKNSSSPVFREEIKINETNPTGEVKKYTAYDQNAQSRPASRQSTSPLQKNVSISENNVNPNYRVTETVQTKTVQAKPVTTATAVTKPTQPATTKSVQPVVTAPTQNQATVLQYIGEIKNGQATGKGTLIYTNGERYVGDVANGVPNGIGTLYDPNGNAILRGKFTPAQ